MATARGGLDELSTTDAHFLREERDSAQMHVGGVAFFAGPPPPIDEVLALVASRLPRVPRYRQRLVAPALGLGRPRWVDDPTFRLGYHVRHTAVPSPGEGPEMRAALARLFGQHLDRTKPLWELWIVEGLPDDGFALVSKTHQALVDGVASADLMSVLLDADPHAPVEPAGGWLAPPQPNPAQLAVEAVGGLARETVALPLRTASLLLRPEDLAVRARRAADLAADEVRARLDPAPPSPLNVPIGPHRRISGTTLEIAELKAVKDALGGSVNDVVLAVVAGAVRSWMHGRGLLTEGLELRAAVPISVAGPGGDDTPAGRTITHLHAPLPIGVDDPHERLDRIRRATVGIKERLGAVDAEALTGGEDFDPPTVLARASRLRLSERLFNLLVTNVPGPRTPMYLLGHQLESMVPIPYLAKDRALAIAVMSYLGRAEVGLLGDLDLMPDLDAVARGMDDALAELVAVAGRRGRRTAARPRARG